MMAKRGFSLAAAVAMRDAQGEWSPDFIRRCRRAEFWGLYDPEPVGGIVIEAGCIHVSSSRPCGLAVRHVVRNALIRHGELCAPIRAGNERAIRLATGLGFTFWRELDGFDVYRRQNT